MILIILSILSLPLAAACYFYSRLWLCIIFGLTFLVSNIIFAHDLLYGDYTGCLYLLLVPCVVLPVSCLIAFALDVKYGIFCIDTTFSILIVWIFAPILLPVNLIILYLGN